METTSSSEGGISVDLAFRCGCLEVLTDSVALLFSVLGVTQQFVGASFFFPPRHLRTNNTLPRQQEEKDPCSLSLSLL